MSERLVPPIHGYDHVPGGPDPIPFGNAVFEIKVYEDTKLIEAGDGKFKFAVPIECDEAVLIDCEAWVTTTPSSGGDVVVTLYNATQAHDFLSTPLTIDEGTLNDGDSAAPKVISTANAEVAYKDELWVNVDNAGTDAMGLGVKLAFAPAAVGALTVMGARGRPGGVTDWQGGWADTTTYNAGDVVVHNGVAYVALQDHTSSAANDEPGVGTNTDDYWAPLVDIPLGASVQMTAVSTSGPVPDGIKAVAVMPFSATITEWVLLADAAGDAEVDVWVSDYAGYPPSSGDSITGGSPPALTAAIKNTSATLTGWTTALTEGDTVVFAVSGVTLAARLTLALMLTKDV